MQQLYQTVPTGDVANNPAATFRLTEQGPVVVMSRATPAVVMVSPSEWNKTAARLAYLERLLVADERRGGPFVTGAELDTELGRVV